MGIETNSSTVSAESWEAELKDRVLAALRGGADRAEDDDVGGGGGGAGMTIVVNAAADFCCSASRRCDGGVSIDMLPTTLLDVVTVAE